MYGSSADPENTPRPSVAGTDGHPSKLDFTTGHYIYIYGFQAFGSCVVNAIINGAITEISVGDEPHVALGMVMFSTLVTTVIQSVLTFFIGGAPTCWRAFVCWPENAYWFYW